MRMEEAAQHLRMSGKVKVQAAAHDITSTEQVSGAFGFERQVRQSAPRRYSPSGIQVTSQLLKGFAEPGGAAQTYDCGLHRIRMWIARGNRGQCIGHG